MQRTTFSPASGLAHGAGYHSSHSSLISSNLHLSVCLQLLDEQATFPRRGTRYIMPDDVLNDWLELDRNLSRATSLIQTYYGIPAVRPISPWAFGYPRRHIDRRHLLIAICKGREWFSVWIALLSYIIAQAESIHAELALYPHLAKVDWKEHLVNNGLEWTWVDSIWSSIVCSPTPRTGVFSSTCPLVTNPSQLFSG